MKLSRSQITNALWIVAILLILFTPVRYHLRMFVGNILFGSTHIVAKDDREILENYNWNLIDLQGNTLSFQDLKGKVVFVNFWATWCPPCVAELPSLVRLHQEYGSKVVFAFVAEDEEEKVRKFLVKKGYQLPVYFETSRTPDLLFSQTIPATYIISKSGEIVVKEFGVAKWDSNRNKQLLEELLAE